MTDGEALCVSGAAELGLASASSALERDSAGRELDPVKRKLIRCSRGGGTLFPNSTKTQTCALERLQLLCLQSHVPRDAFMETPLDIKCPMST